MSMNVSSGSSDEPMCEVNTTPLIDVMLVLLVMLILTLPVQNHAVKLEMPPPSTNRPLENPERINIEIDPDGTVVVNGAAVSGIAELEQFFQRESAKEPQPEIHMRPSGLAQYDVVANVMAAAQRSQMLRMGFTNVAEFAE